MNSIITTYPGFQALPRGIKKMLMVSESLFFEDAKALPQAQASQATYNYRSPPKPTQTQMTTTAPVEICMSLL